MWSSIVIVIVGLIVSGSARRAANADWADEYYREHAFENGRFSDNLREDASLDVPDLIRKYGYPSEVHDVVTEDGYILEMHRIPHGREDSNPDPNRPVVIAMHGLMASAADWVFMGPGTALAYSLADAGFDVWLGNARGTYYSRRHVSLDSVRDIKYWQFSWEEIGMYDLPAMIDYTLSVTNKTRVHYLGHSQGTTAFWVMGSMRPEYNEKIISMQAYAPVAYLEYHENPLLKFIAPFANNIEAITRRLGIGVFLPRPAFIRILGNIFCRDAAVTQPLCTSLVFFFGGQSSESQFNATMFPVKLAHSPAGVSIRQLAHYGQLIGHDHFRRYNHDLLTNWFRYRSFTPPRYDLSKVTAPTYFHYVEEDTFADLRDMDKLWNQLGRPIAKIKVPYVPFSHLDFAWAQNAKAVLYDPTAELMKSMPNN